MIGVIGAHQATTIDRKYAYEFGLLVGRKGYTIICGGLGGVMEEVARGVKEGGGVTIGIVPTYSRFDANPYIDYSIATGMGHARNVIIVATSDVIIAIGGEYGTLSEIGFALKMGKPVVSLRSWDIPGVLKVATPFDAFKKVEEVLG
ncbi:MAG: TIGR00725 family protein [Thermosulfidibacteraceae bacterium]